MRVIAGQGVIQTRNHWWWRPGWAVGTRYYAWHLTFEHCHELHLLAARLRVALARHPVQDVVPDGGLHLTMAGVGFVDDVTDEQLAAISDGVFGQLDTLPDGVLTLDDILVGAEGVLVEARKDSWLMELGRLQQRVIDDVLGPRETGLALWPHVSLSYANGGESASALVADLQTVSPPQDSLVVVRPRVTLMRMHRDSRRYQWDVVRQQVWGAD